MDSTIVILAICDGLSYAALVFLVSVGLSLIFKVHHRSSTRCARVAVRFRRLYGRHARAAVAPISPWLTFPALPGRILLVSAIVGGFIERFLLRPVYHLEEVYSF